MTIEDKVCHSVTRKVFVRGEGAMKGGGCQNCWEAVFGVVEDRIVEAEGNGMRGGARGEEFGDGMESSDVLGFLGSSHPGCGFGGNVYSVVC